MSPTATTESVSLCTRSKADCVSGTRIGGSVSHSAVNCAWLGVALLPFRKSEPNGFSAGGIGALNSGWSFAPRFHLQQNLFCSVIALHGHKSHLVRSRLFIFTWKIKLRCFSVARFD